MTTTEFLTHRVVAATQDGRYVTVPQLVGLEWHAACSAWNALDDARRAGRLPLVSYLVIRQDNDPDPRWRLESESTWTSAVTPPARGSATYDLAPLVVGRQRGYADRHAAARRWGRAHGYVGSQGGWIDRAADPHASHPVCQGWGSLVALFPSRLPTVRHDHRYYVNDLDALAVVREEVAS